MTSIFSHYKSLALLLASLYGVSVSASENTDIDLLKLGLVDLMKIKVNIASKRDEDFIEAPSVVSVITRNQIESYGANNLGDLIERLPAVYRGNLFSIHDAFISIRGQGGEGIDARTLLMINGRPLREYFAGGLNQTIYRGVPISSIERIEMIRGPGSVLYGSGAFSGAINIVTRTNNKSGGTNLSLTAGSFNTYTGEIGIGFNSDSVNGNSVLRISNIDGWDYQARDLAGQMDSQENGNDSVSLMSNWSFSKGGYDLFYSKNKADSIGPNGMWPGTKTNLERSFMNLYGLYDLNKNWQLRGDFTFNSMTSKSDDETQNTKTYNMIYEASIAGSFQKWNFIAGTAFSTLFGDNRINNEKNNTRWYNGYFQSDYKPNEQLKLIAGFQINKPKDTDLDISPRLGLVYQLNENWGYKILYSEAFRTPSWTETNTNIPGVFVGNPDIEPEKIETTDAQIYYRSEATYAALSVFHSKISDIFLVDFSQASVFNSGEIKFDGTEFEWKAQMTDKVAYEGSISWQKNEAGNRGKNTRLTPKWLAKLGLLYNSQRGWTLGVFDNYFSSINNEGALKTNPGSRSFHNLSIKLDVNVNHLLSITTKSKHHISLRVTNALESDPLYQPDEFFGSAINTLPWRSERAFYLSYGGSF